MTVYAITDTKKGRTGIAPTHLQTTRFLSYTSSLFPAMMPPTNSAAHQRLSVIYSIWLVADKFTGPAAGTLHSIRNEARY